MLLRRSSGTKSGIVTTPVPTVCYLGMYMGISGEDRAILMLLCNPWVQLHPNMGKKTPRETSEPEWVQRSLEKVVLGICGLDWFIGCIETL